MGKGSMQGKKEGREVNDEVTDARALNCFSVLGWSILLWRVSDATWPTRVICVHLPMSTKTNVFSVLICFKKYL